MTYNEATQRCLDVAAFYGLESEQYKQAQHEMIVAGRRYMKTLTVSQKLINFSYKIQSWQKKK
jgi:hypothetical protein